MKNLNKSWAILMVLVLAVAFAALVFAACGSSGGGGTTTGGNETPKPGGTYVFPIGSDPISIEPLNVQELDASQVTNQVFQGLYTLKQQSDGSTASVPDLAEKTEVSADAKTFTFTIKQGVKFAPPVSREVTAQDFVDSWNYVMDPANKSSLGPYIFQNLAGLDPKTGYAYPGKKLTSVKLVDKYTFSVTLNQAFSGFPQTMCYTSTFVFPVDYAEKVGRQAFFNKPVGTGPYMVEKWAHNKQLTLVKNPDYWAPDGNGNSAHAGYVDEIDYPIYSDINTEYLAFQKGTVDFCTIPPGSFIAAQNLPNTKNGTWTAKAYPTNAVYFIGVAMNKPLLGGDKNLPIRAALNYAADRQNVTQVVTQGVDIPSDEIVPTIMPGYVAGLNPYPYDPAKAQPELDKFTGTLPQNIPFWFNSGAGHDKIAQALVAGWTKAMPSLTFKLSGIETNAFWTALGENKAPGLFRMGWVADYPLMDNFIYLFTTKGGSYGSYTFYSNKQVDDLFNQARATADLTQANNLYNEAQKIILTDAPCIPVYTYRDARMNNAARIGGFNYDAFSQVDMWEVWVKS